MDAAVPVSNTPEPTVPGGRVRSTELTRFDHRPQGVVQRRLDAREVDQGADRAEQVAQQLGVAALRRDGDDDRVARDLQAEQVDVERVELDLQQLLRGRRRAGQAAALGAGGRVEVARAEGVEQRQQAAGAVRVRQVGDVVQQVAEDLPVAGRRRQVGVDVARGDDEAEQVHVHRRRGAVLRGDHQVEDRGRRPRRRDQHRVQQRLQGRRQRADQHGARPSGRRR